MPALARRRRSVRKETEKVAYIQICFYAAETEDNTDCKDDADGWMTIPGEFYDEAYGKLEVAATSESVPVKASGTEEEVPVNAGDTGTLEQRKENAEGTTGTQVVNAEGTGTPGKPKVEEGGTGTPEQPKDSE